MNLPISVVLCSYNGSRYIEEQLQTILNQTYPISELIVVDDASTDSTVNIVSKIAERDARIQLYRNETNIGYTKNFEKAILLTSTDLIAIADQDDIWVNTKIERMVASFKQESALIYCDSVRFVKNIPVNPVPNKKNKRMQGHDPKTLAIFNTVSGHAMIFRKKLLSSAIPFPQKIYYDWWLAIVGMCNGGIDFLPEILVFQRAHDQNATIQNKLSDAQLSKQFRIMLGEHLNAFRNTLGMSSKDKFFFNKLYILWSASLKKKWNWDLFFFILKNRTILFSYKVRTFPFISQIKHCLFFAFRK